MESRKRSQAKNMGEWQVGRVSNYSNLSVIFFNSALKLDWYSPDPGAVSFSQGVSGACGTMNGLSEPGSA